MSSPLNIYILDANAHIHQAFHAIRELTSPDGRMVNAVYGFSATLLKILRDHRPDALFVAWDAPGPTFRHQRYPAYKATRAEMPEELPPQIDLVKQLLGRMGVPVVEVEGFEADDVIASLAVQAAKKGHRVTIVTTDKDAEQLISDRIRIYNARRDEFRDTNWLAKNRGIRPEQVVDWLALAGDTTDNVPGIPGIGEKTAAKLVAEFGSLEGVLANIDRISGQKRRENLRQHADDARLARELVRLRTDCPVELDLNSARVERLNRAEAAAFFRQLGFHSLLDRLGPVEETPSPAQVAVEEQRRYQVCNRPADLDSLLRRLREMKRFAFDLETTSPVPVEADIVGYAVATDAGQAWYVPVRGPAGTKTLDPQRTLQAFQPLLEDPALEKVGQNLKYDGVVLRQAGVYLQGIAFDTMVASYLLDPGRRRHNLDDLALEYLDYRTIHIEEVLGPGRNQVRMDQVSVERVAKYACEDADVAWRLAEAMEPKLKEAGLWDLFRRVEVPLIDCLVEMESNGVAIDCAVLKEMAHSLRQRLAELEGEIHRAAGKVFNVNSPKQLAEVLFEDLGLPRLKRTRTGYSTDQEVLEELALLHEVPALVVEHRRLAKLLGTYVEALPRMISKRTGRIHTSFNQTVTATGRLSSSDPNLQNIPVRTPEGRAIRRAFVPAREGNLLLTADYSQIELRILAHLSGDQRLRRSFLNDEDIHAAVAAEIAGVDIGKVTPEMRRQAKAVNFGIIYGLSPRGLSRSIGVSVEEARRFIDAYFQRYPGVARFIEEVLQGARRDGFVTTILGRRRPVSGLRRRSASSPTARYTRSAGERIAINTVVQGSAADLIKVAMNRIYRRIRREGRPARMLMQIHDELIFEVPADRVEEERAMVVEEMSQAWKLSVPLKVDTAAGPNWMEAN